MCVADELRAAVWDEGGASGERAFVVNDPVSLEELEGRYVTWVHQQVAGQPAEVARILGVSERTAYRKLQQVR